MESYGGGLALSLLPTKEAPLSKMVCEVALENGASSPAQPELIAFE